AAALRAHPVAGPISTESAGRAEQPLFWQDSDTRVGCGARIDHLPHPTQPGRLIPADSTTRATAAPHKLRRVIVDHGAARRAASDRAGLRAVGLARDAAALFVVQERPAPYRVTAVELAHAAPQIGASLARAAPHRYPTCRRTGNWPG